MPRKSITGKNHKWETDPEGDPNRLKILFIEDGDEEVLEFIEMLKGAFAFHHVSTGKEASTYLKKHHEIVMVCLTMAFPMMPEEKLMGAEEIIFERFGGEDEQAVDFLRKNQGAFILHHIRKTEGIDVPVLFSYDFSSELQRWDTLTSRYDNVYYRKREMGPVDVADFIRTIIERSRPETL